MEDFGNIIYLIVLLLSFVFGIWKKAKKADDEQSTPPVFDEEEIFRRFRGEVEVEVDEIPSPQETLQKEQDALERLKEMERAAKKAKEAGAHRIKTRPRIQLQELDEEEEEEFDVNLSDFDARKAVIYSEILNPPYL
jgi:hypothetical protein